MIRLHNLRRSGLPMLSQTRRNEGRPHVAFHAILAQREMGLLGAAAFMTPQGKCPSSITHCENAFSSRGDEAPAGCSQLLFVTNGEDQNATGQALLYNGNRQRAHGRQAWANGGSGGIAAHASPTTSLSSIGNSRKNKGAGRNRPLQALPQL
jgi:hypothetical protein